MNQVYSKKEYIVIKMKSGFIVINTTKDFNNGHTHIRNFQTAKYLIDLSIHKSIPHHLDNYLLNSLLRLTNDSSYQIKIDELIHNKRRKQVYCNRSA